MGILEALGYGLPCLITTGTTMGDFVQKYNAGWVAETDSQSVFNCIVQAINDAQNLKEKAAGAKMLIESNFDWEKVSLSAIASYQKLLENYKKEKNEQSKY